MRERRVKKGVGGVTKQKMKRDKKGLELEEVRPITGCSVAFKDAWDRWPLQTISLHRAASSPEEIRDSSIPPSTHAPRLLRAPLSSPPPSSHLGVSPSQRRFDVAQREQAAVGHGRRGAAAVLLGHWAIGPLGCGCGAPRPAGLCAAWHFQVSLKRSGGVNPL